MPNRTNIEWADYSSNPLKAHDPKTGRMGWGCARCSPGCTNCYSATLNNRFGTHLDYTVQNVRAVTHLMDDRELQRILRFKPKPPYKGGTLRPKLFPFDMTDAFGEWVSFELLDRFFAVAALRPDVDFLILTKRVERMAEYLFRTGKSLNFLEGPARELGYTLKFDGIGLTRWPLPNVWTGFSAENQTYFDSRWPHAKRLADAGWLTWCSAEPLIGSIDMRGALDDGLRFVIVGGESGPHARPMHPNWARSIRDQCAAAGVAFHYKQWGEWVVLDCIPDGSARDTMRALNGEERYISYDGQTHSVDRAPCSAYLIKRVGKKAAGRLLDGREHNGFPEAREAVTQ